MAVSRGLRRLMQLRLLEEEQSRLALELSLADLHRLERALEAAEERNRRGRQLVHGAAHTGELTDRIAGIEEGRAAQRQTTMLNAAIIESKIATDVLREKYQVVRVERRQVETVIGKAEAAEAVDAGRRSQQFLDDWYGGRRHVIATGEYRKQQPVEGTKHEGKSNGSS